MQSVVAEFASNYCCHGGEGGVWAMSLLDKGARVGAAAVVLGFSLAASPAVGVASAEGPDADSPAASADQSAPAESTRPARHSARGGRPDNSSGSADEETAPAATERGMVRATASQSAAQAAQRATKSGRLDPARARTGSVIAAPTIAAAAAAGAEAPSPTALLSTVPEAGPGSGSAALAAAVVTVGSPKRVVPIGRRAEMQAQIAAPPAAALNAMVNTFFASAAQWLSGLPADPVRDFLSGALLLVRRTIFSFVPAGSTAGGSTTVPNASAYLTDQELHDYLLRIAQQRYGGLFGQTVPVYGYGYGYKFDSAAPVRGGVSDTNTQVAGVDEADFVETDGVHLYVIRDGAVTILDNNSHITSQTAVSGNIVGGFLAGDRLTVITETGTGWYGPYMKMAYGTPWGNWNPQTTVTVYDVSDRAAPTVASQTVFDGSYRAARAVDGTVYVVLDQTLKLPEPRYTEVPVTKDPVPVDGEALAVMDARWGWGGSEITGYRTYETWDEYVARVGDQIVTLALPHAYSVDAEGNRADLGVIADQVVRPAADTQQSLVTVLSIDSVHATAGSGATDSVTNLLSNSASAVYMTPDALYVASAQDGGDSSGNTRIDRFDIAGTAVGWQASGVVAGTLINQFAMDERGGYLRVATHSGWGAEGENGVYVLDTGGDVLDVVGSVTGLAPGEQLYAVRFVGDTAYLVTFLQTDPLFAIDLSDPSAPAVAGELVIPGFSNYLQSVGGGLLLGIGQEREPGTWTTRTHVSLFDVSGGAPTQIARQFLDEGAQWTWSEAQFDHHALLYSAEDGLLVVPVQGGGYDPTTGAYRFDQILTVMHVDAGGITVVAEIHTDQAVSRTVRIGDVLYAVSASSVTAYSLLDFSEIGRVPLGSAPVSSGSLD